ncbi:MAG: hypothetical protein QM802_04670 [Agriterribacter sp.]
MNNLPIYIPVVFIATTFATLYLLFRASGKSKMLMIAVIAWLIVQTIVGLSGFYTNTQTIPPRFIFLILPPLATIAILFISNKGRSFIDQWNLPWATWLHIVRIPVELVLLWLFLHKQVPQLMTFEGRNFDIISGLTAPVIIALAWKKGLLVKRKILLLWNMICLVFLLNIVILAIFAAPFPFQKWAFDQPNIAVLYFPYLWLPGFIVPAVLMAHLVSIRRIMALKN